MIVLGLSGSLRRGSYNTRLLYAATATLPSDARLVIFDGLAAIPPYNEDMVADSPVATLREAIGAARRHPDRHP